MVYLCLWYINRQLKGCVPDAHLAMGLGLNIPNFHLADPWFSLGSLNIEEDSNEGSVDFHCE
jgi:hypothetical protein